MSADSSQNGMMQQVERLLQEVAQQRYGAVARQQARIARAVRALSSDYNSERRSSRRDSATMVARLLFFALADLAKVAFPLAELQHTGHRLPRPLRLLDVGAGCGAQTLGLLVRVADPTDPPRVEVEAIDADREALEAMQEIVARADALGVKVVLRTRCGDLRQGLGAGGPYDLILLGTVLAEIPPARHLPLARTLLQRLAPDGAMVVIEPALRQTSRALHALRDALLEQRLAQVFAPCTRCGPCPALEEAGDWCHESRPWDGPSGFARLAAATGLRRRDLKWAYLTLRRKPGNVAGSRPAWRVVSGQMRSKGRRELFFCGAAGRLRAFRLERNRSTDNEDFAQLQRGQLARIEGARRDRDRLEIERETAVKRTDPGQAIGGLRGLPLATKS